MKQFELPCNNSMQQKSAHEGQLGNINCGSGADIRHSKAYSSCVLQWLMCLSFTLWYATTMYVW